jgi:hypothetical protein
MHYSKYDMFIVQPKWDGMLPLQHMSRKAADRNPYFGGHRIR